MNEEQRTEFMSYGKYLIHYMVYNRKTEQYIDTSNGDWMIVSKEHHHRGFNRELNKVYRLYHMDLNYMANYWGDDCGEIMIKFLQKYQKKAPSKQQEKIWENCGMRIVK